MVPRTDIDVLENTLRRKGDLLDTLLIDRTTSKNLLWATDSYAYLGEGFTQGDYIRPELVTGRDYGTLIQPRAAKTRTEQQRRTKEKGEVFTPKEIVQDMNYSIDWHSSNWPAKPDNWQQYVKVNKLEIACGEAPFIVTRYSPTAHGVLIKLNNRAGFLDRKLHVVSKFCDSKKDWFFWAKEAYKASYGYEWQGDNLLIARENLLYTMIDYYKHKFKTDRAPSLEIQKEFAEIISWNVFQMDGLKYVIPMSCKKTTRTKQNQLSIISEEPVVTQDEVIGCPGCKDNNPNMHTGTYVKIMDWEKAKEVKFIDLINEEVLRKHHYEI